MGRCSASQRRRGYGEIVLYGDNAAVFENICHFTRTFILTTQGMAMCQTILSVSNANHLLKILILQVRREKDEVEKKVDQVLTENEKFKAKVDRYEKEKKDDLENLSSKLLRDVLEKKQEIVEHIKGKHCGFALR